MLELRELYQELILDHNKSPRNFRAMADPDLHANGFNPLCGDKLQLFLKTDSDVITDISFQGEGCAISTASASLLTEQLKGKTLAQARELFTVVHSMLTQPQASTQPLGKLQVLVGVKAFPARVKCASLAWHTLDAALASSHSIATTE